MMGSDDESERYFLLIYVWLLACGFGFLIPIIIYTPMWVWVTCCLVVMLPTAVLVGLSLRALGRDTSEKDA